MVSHTNLLQSCSTCTYNILYVCIIQGYRTGYVYKLPVLKSERTDRQTSEVEYPPATSVLAYYDEKGNLKYVLLLFISSAFISW